MNRTLILSTVLSVFVVSQGWGQVPDAPLIAIIGDSTVEDVNDSSDRRGWGQVLPGFLTPEVSVSNHAIGGRSSQTFLTEGRWQPVLDENPDYVLIQFGHNDISINRPDSVRTDPGVPPSPLPATGFGSEENDWYRLNMAKYVNEARAIGAIPVIVASMERLNFDAQGKIIRYNEAHADAAKIVAADLGVTLIDLHTLSIATYESLGDAASQKYHATNASGGVDRSHFSELGANFYAEEIARQLKSQEPGLAPFIVVPEPMSAALLGVGLLLVRRRRA